MLFPECHPKSKVFRWQLIEQYTVCDLFQHPVCQSWCFLFPINWNRKVRGWVSISNMCITVTMETGRSQITFLFSVFPPLIVPSHASQKGLLIFLKNHSFWLLGFSRIPQTRWDVKDQQYGRIVSSVSVRKNLWFRNCYVCSFRRTLSVCAFSLR